MAVSGEPVARQAAQAQAEYARGEVRGAGGLGQHEEARVADDEEQPQAAPAEPAEAEAVMHARQRVAARLLVGTRVAHAHRAQRNRLVRHLPE